MDIPTDPSQRHSNTPHTHTGTPVAMSIPMRGNEARGGGVTVFDYRQGASSLVLQDSKITKKADDGLSFDSLNETEYGSHRRI